MKFAIREILAVILSVVAAVFFITSLPGPRTLAGKFVFVVVSLVIGVSSLWYIANYGGDFTDMAACVVFSHGRKCPHEDATSQSTTTERAPVMAPPKVEPKAAVPSPPPPRIAIPQAPPRAPPASVPEASNPAPVDWTRYPHRSTLTYPVIDVNTGKLTPPSKGWYEIGSPKLDTTRPPTEEALWTLIERNAGACEPLRQYQTWFPSGKRSAVVAERLSRREKVYEDKPTQVSASSGPYVYDFDKTIYSGAPLDTCIAEVDRQHTDAKAFCIGGETAGRIFGFKTKLENLTSGTTPEKCDCSRTDFFGHRKCTMYVMNTCTWNTLSRQFMERCR